MLHPQLPTRTARAVAVGLRRPVAGAPLAVTAVLGLSLLAAGCASADPRATLATAADELAARGAPGAAARPVAAPPPAALVELLAQPLDPDRAAAVAILANPGLQAELAELGVAHADLAQATRLANPGLSFERLTDGPARMTTLGLAADVVDWLTQPLRRRLAAAELERTRLLVGAAILEQVAAARIATVDLQEAEAVAGLLAGVAELERAGTDYARALHAAGNLTRRDLALLESAATEADAELADATAEVARRREAWLRALGIGPADGATVARLASPPSLPLAGADATTSLEEHALATRLDLAAARWAVDAVDRAYRLRRATRWLPVGIELGVARESERDGSESLRLTGPTVELALPIFDQGGAALARLAAERERARWQLLGVEQAVRSVVRERASDLDAALAARALLAERLLPLQTTVLESTLAEHNQMLVGTFEVVAAKRAEIDVERRLIGATAGVQRAVIALEQALGGPLGAGQPITAPADAAGAQSPTELEGEHEHHHEPEPHEHQHEQPTPHVHASETTP